MPKPAIRAVALCLLLVTACVPKAEAPAPAPPAPALPMVGGAAMDPKLGLYQNVRKSADHRVLIAGVEAAGLAAALSAPGPLTLFAPTDAAFRQLPNGTVEALMHPRSRAELAGIVNYHVVPGAKTRATILADVRAGGGRAAYRTAQGQTLRVTAEGQAIVLTDMNGRRAVLGQGDITQANGILHVVGTVLLPAA